MNTLTRYLIICPLVLIAGFVDAIAGGGGLISLPAYFIAGVPVHAAIATNKMGASMGTALATWRFAKSGLIPWKQALVCAAFALVGSSAGANLALLISDDVFRVIMLIILPLTALYTLRAKALDREQPPFSPKKTLLICSACALGIGIYDGFYGPGTGTFLILLLTGAAHMRLGEANGLTKAINLTSNVSAVVVFLINGKVLLPLGLTAGVFSIIGNLLGAKLFLKKGADCAKPIIIVVLAIFFIKTLYEAIV